MAAHEALDALARAAREGGPRESDVLLAELRPLVCRWALVWIGSPDLAEDIAQRVLVKVHGSIRGWRPGSQFTTWAYRITRNELIDVTRRDNRQRELRYRVRLEELAQKAVLRNGSFERASEARVLLDEMMHALSPQQRAVLDLVALQGFSAVEAAEMLDVTPSTVRVHLHRARAILRARSTEEDE